MTAATKNGLARAAWRRAAGAVISAVMIVGLGAGNAAGAATAQTAALGKVTAVNGSSAAGACGTAGAAGTFDMVTRAGTRTVAVTPTTTFYKPGVPSRSFANVCVNGLLGVVGTLSGNTLNARLVVLPPPLPGVAVGMVTSVNGSSASGTCGTAGASGSFTLATLGGAKSVAVTPATAFYRVPSSVVSFASVCVNNLLGAVGTNAGAALNADKVLVWSRAGLPPGGTVALGKVTSVNGSTAPGTCGATSTAGSFVIATRSGARTIGVTATTTFYKPGVSSASFSKVCVNNLVGVIGTLSGTTLNARLVAIAPPLPATSVGMVSSVNGSSTPGACGTAGASGTFTLSTLGGSQAVTVAPTTAFYRPGTASPSFSSVCVSRLVAVVGTTSGSGLSAGRVFIWSNSF